MSFRRSGHSDERRRRVLMDDASASSEATAAPAKPARERKASKGRTYFDVALADNQPPVTALIPARVWTLSVLLLSGLTLVALLNLLHAELPRLSRLFGAEHLDAINFAVRGNLAAWLSAAFLAYAAFMSLHIYNLRRHRVDDYKGRYRIWIPVVALLAFASLDAASGLHDALGGIVAKYASKSGALSSTICWVTLASIIAGAVSLRLMLEMRRSLGSVAALVAAMAFYALAVSVRIGWLPLDPDLGWHTMVSATLLGHLFVCFTSLAYGSHVYLDAQGLLKVKKPKEAKAKKKKEEDKAADEKSGTGEKSVAGKQVRIDGAHGSESGGKPAASTSGGPLKAAISAATNKTPAAAANNANDRSRQLSKAERKRLRRQGGDDGDDEDDE